MKKIILASLIATLGLTACDKKPAEPAQPTTDTQSAEVSPVNTEMQASEHDHDDKHGHADHDHHHDAGDKFQCGDKTVHIAVHNHEGEIEAHLTADDIVYDLNQDPQDKQRFMTDDGIEGEDKPMTLILNGDKAQVLNNSSNVLLDCTKS